MLPHCTTIDAKTTLTPQELRHPPSTGAVTRNWQEPTGTARQELRHPPGTATPTNRNCHRSCDTHLNTRTATPTGFTPKPAGTVTPRNCDTHPTIRPGNRNCDTHWIQTCQELRHPQNEQELREQELRHPPRAIATPTGFKQNSCRKISSESFSRLLLKYVFLQAPVAQ